MVVVFVINDLSLMTPISTPMTRAYSEKPECSELDPTRKNSNAPNWTLTYDLPLSYRKIVGAVSLGKLNKENGKVNELFTSKYNVALS